MEKEIKIEALTEKECLELIAKRDNIRKNLNSATYEERLTPEYSIKNKYFNKLHKNIVVPIELKIGKPATRVVYSICGYSIRHGYFRSKYETVDSLDQAKTIFNGLKKDTSWGIPTIIVEVTFKRVDTLGCYDFDNNPADDLGFSQDQKVVAKHMMGVKGYSWRGLLDGLNGDYTY